jgi:opacity protein-like surface antigen
MSRCCRWCVGAFLVLALAAVANSAQAQGWYGNYGFGPTYWNAGPRPCKGV